MKTWLVAAVALTAAAALAQQSAPPASASDIRQCGICHDRREFKVLGPGGEIRPLFVDTAELADSVHAKWGCVDCHADIERIPHAKALQPVNCQRCHFPGNPVGAPEDVNYEGYVKSVHGRLRAQGNQKAPLCQNCHGGHAVRKADDPASRVSKQNVPATCGSCHPTVYADYVRSQHGVALLDDANNEAPSSSSCHGEHDILPPREDASEVSASHIPETCSSCHGALEFNTKYGIPVNPVSTFKHTFHGIANELGSNKVAQCASCHTAHLVLPPDDSSSSVNEANIPATCGKPECHPGANANYARGRFHVDPTSKDSGIIYWVALFFKILTISTMVGLVLHILLDLRKRLAHRHQGAGE